MKKYFYSICWILLLWTNTKYSFGADAETFWVGKALTEMKERPVNSEFTKLKDGKPYRYSVRDAITMACFRPTPVFGVLIRGEKCHILDASNLPDEIGKLPVQHGDKVFRFRNREELERLNIPILEGGAAANSILAGSTLAKQKTEKK